MLLTLALRNLVLRPWRSLLLLAGFGLWTEPDGRQWFAPLDAAAEVID